MLSTRVVREILARGRTTFGRAAERVPELDKMDVSWRKRGIECDRPLERVGHELVVVMVAAVHRPAALPALPGLVLLGRHGGEVVEDGVANTLFADVEDASVPVMEARFPDDVPHFGVVGIPLRGRTHSREQSSRQSPVRKIRIATLERRAERVRCDQEAVARRQAANARSGAECEGTGSRVSLTGVPRRNLPGSSKRQSETGVDRNCPGIRSFRGIPRCSAIVLLALKKSFERESGIGAN